MVLRLFDFGPEQKDTKAQTKAKIAEGKIIVYVPIVSNTEAFGSSIAQISQHLGILCIQEQEKTM